MDIQILIGKGYFSEELPPPFTSSLLGKKIKLIQKPLIGLDKKVLPNNSVGVNYSAPKIGIHRRIYSIPNPYPQIRLSESIIKNWTAIVHQFSKSKVSVSTPEVDPSNKRAIIYLHKLEKFKELSIKFSAIKLYELHIDISKYFYSIYTHSIPWAIHSKANAKADKTHRLWGNEIDTHVRDAQSNQTKGIPVGTDTSRIIAEIIGADIDAQFHQVLVHNNIDPIGLRFVDDCRYYFDSLADAEFALKEYSRILLSYSLNLNEEKTIIKVRPCTFDKTWKLLLNSYPLESGRDKAQRAHLKNYFNLLISLSIQNPKDSVIKYGIKRIRKLDIHFNNIDIFEPLLFSITITEPSILPDTLFLLQKYEKLISKSHLEKFTETIIKHNIHKGHHFEVSWALWIAKCFNIKIPLGLAKSIMESLDSISILILLDLYHSKLIDNRLNINKLISDLGPDSLNNEFWLLAYESEIKNWLPLSNIATSPFFKLLSQNKISFYDNSFNPITSGKVLSTSIQTKTSLTKNEAEEY